MGISHPNPEQEHALVRPSRSSLIPAILISSLLGAIVSFLVVHGFAGGGLGDFTGIYEMMIVFGIIPPTILWLVVALVVNSNQHTTLSGKKIRINIAVVPISLVGFIGLSVFVLVPAVPWALTVWITFLLLSTPKQSYSPPSLSK